MGRSKHSVACQWKRRVLWGSGSRCRMLEPESNGSVKLCMVPQTGFTEHEPRRETRPRVVVPAPGPRAGNIINSSKSARPPWAIGTTCSTSPQSPSTAFEASVLYVSQGFPHAGPGGRRIREGCAHCRRPRKNMCESPKCQSGKLLAPKGNAMFCIFYNAGDPGGLDQPFRAPAGVPSGAGGGPRGQSSDYS